MKTQFKLKNTKILFFLLLLPFFAWSQIDSVNIGGTYHCSRDVWDIMKKNKKNIGFSMPENFTSDPVQYKIDSSYIFINKRKYVQKVYSSKKIVFKTLISVDKAQRKFYVHNLTNNKKSKLEFIEPCDITFAGIKLHKNKFESLLFKAEFDGYKQHFTLTFNGNLVMMNFERPYYIVCH